MHKDKNCTISDMYHPIIPATIKRDFEDFKAGTKIAIDALDYSKAGKDDLIVSYLESSDEMIRIPKMLIELEDGEGI